MDRTREPNFPRSPSTRCHVVEFRKAFGGAVEFSNFWYVEAFFEFLPDLTAETVSACHDTVVCFVVRRRWGSDEVPAQLSDVEDPGGFAFCDVFEES